MKIRKLVTIVEEVLSDGGREAKRAVRKAAAVVVLENPFAGRFVDDLTPLLASVSGQVIRTGIFQEKVFNEAFGFKLTLRLIRNPNMAMNGRFPTAVGDFKYEISK